MNCNVLYTFKTLFLFQKLNLISKNYRIVQINKKHFGKN
jgi:hypothetical protein